MIVDVHSHTWQYPQHFTDDFRNQARRAKAGEELDLTVRYEDYQRTSVSSASCHGMLPIVARCFAGVRV